MKKILFDFSGTHRSTGVLGHGGGVSTYRVFKLLLQHCDRERIEVVVARESQSDPRIRDTVLSSGVEVLAIDSLEDLYVQDHGDRAVFYSGQPYALDMDRLGIARSYLHVHGLRAVELPADISQLHYEQTLTGKVKALAKLAGRSYFKAHYERTYREFIRKCRGTQVIVPSLHTKYTIKRLCPDFELERISVAGSLLDESVGADDGGEDANRVDAGKPAFLMTGAGRWDKNALMFVRAFLRLRRRGQLDGFRLQLTGVEPGHHLHRYTGPDIDIGEFVSPERLRDLYRNAYCLVYPSKSEGYGYPPLEAMSQGCPAIVSSTTSIPEVCLDHALLFNPHDDDELDNRLLQMAYEPGLRDALARRSKDHARVVARESRRQWNELIEQWVDWTR